MGSRSNFLWSSWLIAMVVAACSSEFTAVPEQPQPPVEESGSVRNDADGLSREDDGIVTQSNGDNGSQSGSSTSEKKDAGATSNGGGGSPNPTPTPDPDGDGDGDDAENGLSDDGDIKPLPGDNCPKVEVPFDGNVDYVLADDKNATVSPVGFGWIGYLGTNTAQYPNGINGQHHYAQSFDEKGLIQFCWKFNAVPAGNYRVFATWPIGYSSEGLNTDAAPYEIYDGSTLTASPKVDQRYTPQSLNAFERSWHELGVVRSDNGVLLVKLTNNISSGKLVRVDAIAIESVD